MRKQKTMEVPSQANKVAGVHRVPKRREERRKEEDDEQQQPIQEHPTGECTRQATKGEVPVETLNIVRDTVMSSVINQLDGELNPKPAYNSEVYFEHNRFCEDCIDKVATAIIDGLRKERKKGDKQHKKEKEDAPVTIDPIEEEKDEGKGKKAKGEDDDSITNASSCPSDEEEDVITPDNARLVARAFLNKLNFRVNDHVSLEFFNRKGMKKCLDRDLFGGLPYAVARVVDSYGHNGKYAISENLLGQHAYAATRSTGIIYDDNDQDPVTRLSDHSGRTIGEVLSSAIGNKRCSCMQSENFKDNEREDVEELANLAKCANYNTTPYNGYDNVMFDKTVYFSSRDSEVKEEDDSDSDSEVKEEDDSDSDSEVKEEDDSDSDSEVKEEDDSYSDSEVKEEDDSDSDSEGKEPAIDGVKRRIVNDDFRPSRSVKAESDRGDAPPLCLSICRHFNGNNCPFNAENKQKIYNAINFVKQELKGEEGDGGVVALIDGERHEIEICTTNTPSFAIGSSVYEIRVYDYDFETAAIFSSSNKNAPDDVKYDHAMKVAKTLKAVSGWEDEERETRMSKAASVLCDQIFAKPCAKAYLTVTTAAVPWPCILKTPPMSDVNSEGKYGSYISFVVPLPCSYGGRRLNDSTNGWRSRVYSNFIEDFVKRSVRPVPMGRLLDLSGNTWNLSTRDHTHHQLRFIASVLRSECGDLDPSPLEYHKASTLMCSRDAIEAHSDISKLRRLLNTCNKDLDTFTDGPYREAIFKMRNFASEIEQEMEKNTEEEDAARKVLLETLNGQFEEQRRRVVFMSELATKQNNFRLQLKRQLNNLSHLCASFVSGF